MNDIIVNPDNFRAMIMNCDKKENKYDLQIKFWKACFNNYFILYIFIKVV